MDFQRQLFNPNVDEVFSTCALLRPYPLKKGRILLLNFGTQ